MRHACAWTRGPGEVLVTFFRSYPVVLEIYAIVLIFSYGKERLSQTLQLSSLWTQRQTKLGNFLFTSAELQDVASVSELGGEKEE